jgi:predicted house-cleaning NTP pyrophosphatase (Maf/HAM1 superfamily)
MQECGNVVDKNFLYCASQSQARHALLQRSEIPFIVIGITVREEDAQVSGTVQEQVAAIAEYKHSGIDVAAVVRQQTAQTGRLYFLTADTLIAGVDTGMIYGKPRSHAHAIEMVQQISRQEIIVATGMCLSVWEYDQITGRCDQLSSETWVADALAEFSVPDSEIEHYLSACPVAMQGCGATVVDGIGILYFKSIRGSYSGTLGLDMFGLRLRLNRQGFYRLMHR